MSERSWAPGPDPQVPPSDERSAGSTRSGRGVGVGAVVAVVGLVLFALSLFVLPWVSQGGEEATLAEIGRSLDDVAGADGPGSWEVDYLRTYADRLALRVVIMLAVAVTFSTLVVPRGRVLRVVTGSVAVWAALPDVSMILISVGLLGLLVSLMDSEGTVGPKVAAVLVVVGVGATHGFAVHLALDETTPAPDPASGIWIGLAGLVAICAGVLIGTRRASTSPTV